MPDAPVIACRLSTHALAARLADVRSELVAAAVRNEVIPGGRSLELPGADEQVQALFEFVRYERECCPFFDFRVTVPADGQAVSLAVMGPAEAQKLIDTLLGPQPMNQDTTS